MRAFEWYQNHCHWPPVTQDMNMETALLKSLHLQLTLEAIIQLEDIVWRETRRVIH